jgi:SAM-dependent methyltransferase
MTLPLSYPLSKTLDPESDYVELAEELKIVDRHFHSAREQHPHRRFEYALALRALRTLGREPRRIVYDVGGAGSPFHFMLNPLPARIEIIDPDKPPHWTLEQYCRAGAELSDAVFCLSVLEHVDDLDRFLYHLSCLVAPGGLLFLTMDCCNSLGQYGTPEDTYHFHWMRKRIFNAYSLGDLVAAPLLQRDFTHLGSIDLTWHGPQVYDYSFCSLALVKRS